MLGGVSVKILLVEDEKLLARTIRDFLVSKGFQVEVVYDGETGAEYALLGIYDLLILDIMIPGINGYQVARQVRAHRCTVPILMLTARSDLESRIEGLNAGADYYLTKPFDTRELLACINALVRRQGTQMDSLTFGNTELDLSTCMLRCGEKLIPKETLLARVWGYETNAVENHVEVYMAFLRKKLKSIGSNVNIVAIRRMGYHLELKNHD